jgi:benzoate-CoA ligase
VTPVVVPERVNAAAFFLDRHLAEGRGGPLRATVKQRLAGYKAPRWIEFVAALPRTATGKIQRFHLRE